MEPATEPETEKSSNSKSSDMSMLEEVSLGRAPPLNVIDFIHSGFMLRLKCAQITTVLITSLFSHFTQFYCACYILGYNNSYGLLEKDKMSFIAMYYLGIYIFSDKLILSSRDDQKIYFNIEDTELYIIDHVSDN
ncbi:hypothetical protein BD560DRAFT_419477 [Blakeslea trispora]|nr:hypothetical protein BD560DRAFT_419477 [Blakeslea trispora]